MDKQIVNRDAESAPEGTTEGETMSEQQKFQPGDKIKVTMNLSVADLESGGIGSLVKGTALSTTVKHWANECDHIDVELIERAKPPLEPGWYLCDYGGVSRAMRWDGEKWCWPETGMCVPFQNNVTVVSDQITLREGVGL